MDTTTTHIPTAEPSAVTIGKVRSVAEATLSTAETSTVAPSVTENAAWANWTAATAEYNEKSEMYYLYPSISLTNIISY